MTSHFSRQSRISTLFQSPAFDSCLFAVVVALLLAHDWRLLDQVVANSTATSAPTGIDRVVLCATALALLFIGFVHRRDNTVGKRAAMGIGALCGCLCFFTWIGSGLLNPVDIQWLLHGDWAQHYSAWTMYRSAPWTWPPGLIQTLWYPVGTAIVHTDALPLLAFAFKPFTGVLPDDFQYIGLWLLTSCALQGLFAALLVWRLRPSAVAVLCGSLLFLLSPIFLGRFFHDTLTAQWLLLAGFWLYFRTNLRTTWVHEAWPCWILATIAALVHPYLSVMFLAIVFGYWLRRVKVDHAQDAADAIKAVSIAIALTLIVWWLSGAFTIRFRDGGGGLAYGVHSFNLLGFLIPQGFSRIVPSIPLANPGQWEGQAYLGLGILTLISLLALESILRRRRPTWPRHWPLMFVAFALFLFAASTTLTVGPWKLTDISIKSPLLATFRSSGRFIWIPYYLIVLATIAGILARFPTTATLLLALAVVGENWEFSPMHSHFAHLRTGVGWAAPEKQLVDPEWNLIVRARRHLTMFPPASCGKQAGPYLPFQLLAAKHGMTFNSGYLARWNLRATQVYCGQLVRDSDAHRFSSDDVYVVDPSWQSKISGMNNLECHILDGYRACVLAKIDAGG